MVRESKETNRPRKLPTKDGLDNRKYQPSSQPSLHHQNNVRNLIASLTSRLGSLPATQNVFIDVLDRFTSHTFPPTLKLQRLSRWRLRRPLYRKTHRQWSRFQTEASCPLLQQRQRPRHSTSLTCQRARQYSHAPSAQRCSCVSFPQPSLHLFTSRAVAPPHVCLPAFALHSCIPDACNACRAVAGLHRDLELLLFASPPLHTLSYPSNSYTIIFPALFPSLPHTAFSSLPCPLYPRHI